MKLEINLNETVEVKLTKFGADVYNCRWDDLHVPPEYKRKEYAEGDVLRIQLWALMQEFGHHIHLGMRPLFEGNNIVFNKDIS